MALFRFHRGGLQDSLMTTVIVKNINELSSLIFNYIEPWVNIKSVDDIELTIESYPSENNFDSRIGWYTHLVSFIVKVDNPHYSSIKASPVGYLSEPLL